MGRLLLLALLLPACDSGGGAVSDAEPRAQDAAIVVDGMPPAPDPDMAVCEPNACGVCGAAPVERCNGGDDDCDGEIDEGVLNACGGCGPVPVEV